jgi:hypothetical protein
MSRRLFGRQSRVLPATIIGAALFAGPAVATVSPSYPDYPQCLLRAMAPLHNHGDSEAQPRARIDGCGRYPALVNPAGASQGTYRVRYEARLVAVDGNRRTCIPLANHKCSFQGNVDVQPRAGTNNDFVITGALANCNEDPHGSDEIVSQARVQVFNFHTNSYVAWSGWDSSAVVTMSC